MNSVRYVKETDVQAIAQFMADELNQVAKNRGSVLVLLSGGSAIALAVALRQLIDKRAGRWCFSLVDERYGPPNHADSNWAQLLNAGFSLEGVDYYSPLAGADFPSTVLAFNNFLAGAGNFGLVAGLFGMGADGHTAGILPRSPATSSKELACGYLGPDYQRLTITPRFITKMEKAYLYAMGENKHQQFDKLETDLSVADQPAQVLKQVPALTVFNDYRGDSL